MANTSTTWLSWLTNWGGWFQSFVTWGVSASAAVFWALIGRNVLCWLEWMFCWVVALGLGLVVAPLNSLVKYVPAFPALVIDPIRQVWLVADYYAPVNEALAGAAVAFLVIACFRLFRFVKQFVWGSSN